MTKFQLFSALAGNSMGLTYVQIDGDYGYIQSIQREDGSGRCFNVTFIQIHTGKTLTKFVRTID